MTDLISIIIPVFNVDKYIVECFESILSQEHQKFEVILIDDGSTDNSGKICDEYAAKDNRFKVFHTENRGIGLTRNLGMDKMSGDYCFFLDPDDVIEPDSLSYLLSIIEKNNADIALSVTRQFHGDYVQVGKEDIKETVYYGKTAICEQVLFDKSDMKPLSRKSEQSKVTYEFFSSLYRTDFLNKHNIRFLPISYGEDTYVCLKTLLNSSVAVTSTKTTYSHRRNPTSTTFQYHPYYLDETKEYYRYYIGLFEDFAPEYIERATEALDGQYFRRCVSAVDREIFMSPQARTTKEMNSTIRQIRKDKKFRSLCTFENIKYINQKITRIVLYCIKFGIYAPLVAYLRYRKNKG